MHYNNENDIFDSFMKMAFLNARIFIKFPSDGDDCDPVIQWQNDREEAHSPSPLWGDPVMISVPPLEPRRQRQTLPAQLRLVQSARPVITQHTGRSLQRWPHSSISRSTGLKRSGHADKHWRTRPQLQNSSAGDLLTTCKLKNTDATLIYMSTNAIYQFCVSKWNSYKCIYNNCPVLSCLFQINNALLY